MKNKIKFEILHKSYSIPKANYSYLSNQMVTWKQFGAYVLSKTINYAYKRFFTFSLIIIVLSLLLLQGFQTDSSDLALQESISSEIIRFHVIANSDSSQDQGIKLKIKEALIDDLGPILASSTNITEARTLLKDNLDRLEHISNKIIQENGYPYSATASIERDYFPLKVYGDLTLPPGEYESVRIELGVAEGQNWWCIMFPPLCFVDATYSIVPNDSKELLKNILTEEEYRGVFSNGKTEVQIKFKLLTLLKDLFQD